MEGEVSKQPAHPPDVSYPDAPASGVSLPRPKPVMTHQQRGSGGGDGPLSLLKPPRSALNQICSKPRGSPRETKTKIKGPFFSSAGAVSSPPLRVSPTLLPPLSRAGSRKLPSTLNHEGRRQQSGSRTIKKKKKKKGCW